METNADSFIWTKSNSQTDVTLLPEEKPRFYCCSISIVILLFGKNIIGFYYSNNI